MRPIVLAVTLLLAAPAAASSTTSTTSTTTTSTSTTTTTTTPPPVEVPADEAKLLALLSTVHARLDELNSRLAQLDASIASNQAQLDAANADVAAATAAVAVADGRLSLIRVAQAGALAEIRRVAVAAYVHEPIGDLANMLLHLSTPADLVDAAGFYRTVVDVQEGAIKAYDRLTTAAHDGVQRAASTRETAARKQQAVAATQDQLQSLRQTLVGIQQATAAQASQQTNLLSLLGSNKAQFEAELAAQAAESANIAGLLQSLSSSGSSGPAPTGGYFALPVPGAPVTQRFGPNSDPFTGIAGFHPGVDFGAPTGTQIHAAGDGTVVYAGEESGYGNYTCITHGGGIATCYGHQSLILVKVGDHVSRGQVIGLVGSTGYSTGPHLHFEVRVNGSPVDPLPWLRT